MKKFKKWFSITKEKNARGLLLLSIVVFNICLWFFSSMLAYIIAPGEYGTVAKALWESGITWMLEPGFYDPSVHVSIRIISIIVIITSMITFTGGIIGYVASLFSAILESSQRGRGKLNLYDHILILNWNTKALELISDYRYDDEATDVVVLSHLEKEVVENAIKRKFYDDKVNKHGKINVIVREGEVFSKSDLMSVCIEQAKTIIILADEEKSASHIERNADILAMKTLMLVSNLEIKPEQTIIVEVKSEHTIDLIQERIALNIGLKEQVIPILPDEMMGRLIAQTILMPDLNQVYKELFSFEGAEIYTIPKVDPIQYMETHNHCIPIYNRGENLFVLAEFEKNIYHTREVPLSSYQKIKINQTTRYHDKSIVIFGKNNKLKYILDSIHLYQKENNTTVHVTLIESNEPLVIQESIKSLQKIDTILILSADYLRPKDFDSDVLVTLLMIQEIAKSHQSEIIIELLDPRHFDIAQSYNIQNTIISNKYISRLITQLSKNRFLYAFYNELLNYDAEDAAEQTYEIYAYRAEDIFKNTFPLVFKSRAEFIYSCFMSGKQGYIMIGYIHNHIFEIFKGDLDVQEEIMIEANDTIIAICK